MNTPNEEQSFICHECVGDEFLKKEIQVQGKREKCTYCGKSRKSMPLSWLAESIHTAIQENFYLTSNEPEPYEYALIKDKEINYEWVRKGQEVY